MFLCVKKDNKSNYVSMLTYVSMCQKKTNNTNIHPY